MDVCGNCGRTRRQGAAFCTGCGSRFADDPQPAWPVTAAGLPGTGPPGTGPPGTGESLGATDSYRPTEASSPAGPYPPAGSYPPAGPYPPPGPYPPAGPYPPTAAPPYRPAVTVPPGPPRHPRRSRTGLSRLTFRPGVVAVVVVMLVAAAATSGALLYVRHHSSSGAALRNSSQSTRPTTPAQSAPGTPSQDVSTPAPSPSSASPSPSADNAVTVGPDAAQDPSASSVAGFLGQYFAAINAHDYQSYVSLLGSQLQQGMTQAQFEKGYRSTADSNETLVGISTASDGDLAAEVTFTSHQNPEDSPDQSESCTEWDVSLFLAQSGSGYLIDPAPSGYKASYSPCS